jgi:hypothetical protein
MSSFNFKTFTSFLLALTFLALLLSGAVLFVSPPGRVAHWTHWTLLGLSKEAWSALHILIAVVFLTGGLFHLLKFNWKVFVHYLSSKRSGFQHKRELIASLGLFSLVLVGTLAQVPPFVSVMGIHDQLKEYWDDGTDSPPVPHMELMNLTEVASHLQVSPERVLSQLRAQGLETSSYDQTLKQVAENNAYSPQGVLRLLQGSLGHDNASDSVPHRKGLGRMTLAEVSQELGMPIEQTVDILQANGLEGEPQERIRDIAARAKLPPQQLAALLRER